jgi:hypothetical protein
MADAIAISQDLVCLGNDLGRIGLAFDCAAHQTLDTHRSDADVADRDAFDSLDPFVRRLRNEDRGARE